MGDDPAFSSGCNLRCVFCRNFDISWQVHGEPVTAGRLAAMMLALQIMVIGVPAADARPRATGAVVWSSHDHAVDVQAGPAELLPVPASPGVSDGSRGVSPWTWPRPGIRG